jgi:hypothetical protein
MPRKLKPPKEGWVPRPRVNSAEPVAAFAWTKPHCGLNVFCWYRQEDVPEPGCHCPTQLRAEGYDQVRDNQTCVDYFRGRFLVATGEEEEWAPTEEQAA